MSKQTRATVQECLVLTLLLVAPEIIEQNGATTASDIWSLGCLVIELLDARPPYSTLEPMQALFRIVQDDSPPIPEGASPVVRDFLSQCFQKDPNLRVSAKKLARHPWMTSGKPDIPVAPVASPLLPKRSRTVRPRTTSTHGLAPRPLTTAYAQAVKRVQEWNEAINSAPTKARPLRRVAPMHSQIVESSSSGDSLAAHLSAAKPRSRLVRVETSDDGNWDNDFDDLPPKLQEDNTKTVMPVKSPRDEEDWSDLGPFNEGDLKRKLRALKNGSKVSRPDDISRIEATWKSTKKPRPRLISPVNLAKWAEDDAEDLSDLVIEDPIRTNTLQLNSRHSDRSWNTSEDQDPFEALDDAFTVEDIEANLERDKGAKLCASVVDQIDALQPKSSDGELLAAIDQLLSLLDASPDLADHFVSHNGPMCVVEMIESRRSRQITLELLRLVNRVAAPESFCLVGGIPPIMSLTAPEHPLATRVEAAAFVESLTTTPATLSMFIACRGLQTLVGLLDEDWHVNRALVLSALKGITSVFALPAATSKDYCRLFVREGIAEAMSNALDGVVDFTARQQLVNLVLLFCQNVQSDPRIRDALGTRHFVSRLIDVCPELEPQLLITMLKALKHLSAAPSLRDVLDNANAIRFLVRTLSRSDGANDICSHILQTLYNLCRLSRSRQGEAARSGLLPVLRQLIDGNSQLKDFALPIVCEMVNAGKEARRQLWRIDGLALYLSLLEDPYWRISSLEAIVTWLQDETARVEDRLLEKSSTSLLLLVFTKATGVSFDGILEPWSKILRTSRAICLELAQGPMYKRIADALGQSSTKATTRLALLRVLKTVGESHSDRSLASKYGIGDILSDLAERDEAVLVRQVSTNAVECFSFALIGRFSSPKKSQRCTRKRRGGSHLRHASGREWRRDECSMRVCRGVLVPPIKVHILSDARHRIFWLST